MIEYRLMDESRRTVAEEELEGVRGVLAHPARRGGLPATGLRLPRAVRRRYCSPSVSFSHRHSP
jgi:hypothetical protein